ncbi:hypothetical protein LCGC14_1342730, partial [marine sediment metagenome]
SDTNALKTEPDNTVAVEVDPIGANVGTPANSTTLHCCSLAGAVEPLSEKYRFTHLLFAFR